MRFSTFFITHDVEEALILFYTVYILNGTPGKITRKIEVNPNRPRDSNFPVSKEFVEQKRLILTEL
jgi:ABC-type nitrate/sulfonate/bicarbonate transport system ATPase subunit